MTAAILTCFIFACTKDSGTNTDQYSDKLTLGASLNPSNLFQLIGETTSFIGPNAMICWRLESKTDMAGSGVTIQIKKLVNGSYTALQSIPYTNPHSYGHIMLSSFTLNQTGSFLATGILAATSKTVASREFTVQ